MYPNLVLLRNYLTPAERAAIEIPPSIQEIITGLMLGDGSILKDKRYKNSNA